MTDYELAILFTETFALFQDQYMNYVTVLFAFLIAAFLVADKLKPVMAFTVVALFTAFAVDSMIVIAAFSTDISTLQQLMHERVLNGSVELTFNSGAGENYSPGILNIMTISRVLVVFGGYIGAMGFFFYQRRMKSK